MCSLLEAKESVTLNAVHNGAQVVWSDNSVGNSYITDQSGFFDAVVYDSYGCSSEDRDQCGSRKQVNDRSHGAARVRRRGKADRSS